MSEFDFSPHYNRKHEENAVMICFCMSVDWHFLNIWLKTWNTK